MLFSPVFDFSLPIWPSFFAPMLEKGDEIGHSWKNRAKKNKGAHMISFEFFERLEKYCYFSFSFFFCNI